MKDVQCKKCRYLLKDKDGYNWCPNKTFVDDPDIDLIRDCEWYAVKTNADRIRSMTDEELAKSITDDLCDRVCHSPLSCDGNCETQVLAWLKQEYTP